jgi:hypothetical protein
MKSLNLKCYSCHSKISPENPCSWLGLKTYCMPCWNNRIKPQWKGMQYYDRTGEDYPK